MIYLEAKIDKDRLIVTLPINAYTSPSGKTIVIASSHGNLQTGLEYKGKDVVIGLNAYIRNDKKV